VQVVNHALEVRLRAVRTQPRRRRTPHARHQCAPARRPSDYRQTAGRAAPHDGGMTDTRTAYRIAALPAAVLDEARAAPPAERHCARGGEPLRCCLRDAAVGEGILLFSYEPPLPDSPYREKGAVFAHAVACAGPPGDLAYPADWYDRPQVLRAYDSNGRIHPASRQHDGSDPVAALTAVLAEPGVVVVHSRNVVYGCYMFAAAAG